MAPLSELSAAAIEAAARLAEDGRDAFRSGRGTEAKRLYEVAVNRLDKVESDEPAAAQCEALQRLKAELAVSLSSFAGGAPSPLPATPYADAGAQPSPGNVPSSAPAPRPTDAPAALESAKVCRDEGNDAFRAGRDAEAKGHYEGAIALLQDAARSKCVEVKTEATQLRLAVHGNLAACALRLNDLKTAVDAATVVLREDPRNVKALYRRATARRRRGEFNAARADLKVALQVEPGNSLLRQEAKVLKDSPHTDQAQVGKTEAVVDTPSKEAGWDIADAVDRSPFWEASPGFWADVPSVGFHPVRRELQKEVEACRDLHKEGVLKGVVSIGDVLPVLMVTSLEESKEVIPNPSAGQSGPWMLEVQIHGPPPQDEVEAADANPGAYDKRYVVELCFPYTYPDVPPRIRFRTEISHGALGAFGQQHERRVGKEFYLECVRRLPEFSAGRPLKFRLRYICELLCELLRAGVSHTWGPQLRALAKSAGWEELRRHNWEAIELEQRYRAKMRRPELCDASRGFLQEWLDPELAAAIFQPDCARRRAAIREAVTEVSPGVFSFRLLTENYCKSFLAELDHLQAAGLPAERPNSMNAFGIILNAIGWGPMADALQQEVLQPLAEVLYPAEGARLDAHHAFIVRYRESEDLGLDMHVDDSDVTFNVALGREFSEGGLVFCGMQGSSGHRRHTFTYRHEIGRCVAHLGRHRHGAADITAGERVNLILWNHSLLWRCTPEFADHVNQRRESKEAGQPDVVCLSYQHDRDYGVFRDYAEKIEGYRGIGHVPTTEAAYDGFRPEGDGL